MRSFWFQIYRFPFDWKTLNGYLGAISFQYVMTWYFVFLNACIIFFSFGSIFTLITFTKDIIACLKSFNESVKNNENRLQSSEQLFACIRFHSAAKQLSKHWEPILCDMLLTKSNLWSMMIWNLIFLGWLTIIRTWFNPQIWYSLFFFTFLQSTLQNLHLSIYLSIC